MKNETIFKHELNESIQADAAMNCLKNRNKPQQMNEALPLVAGAVRLAMPLLRPLITKLVKSLVMKAGAKLTGRQVAKMVIKNVANGKTLMKVGKKVGQTWSEIPTELKQEIAKTAINTFKEMRQPKQEVATQEQEETSDFDARFEFRKDLRELASPVAKKAYMIIRKQYGDGMWRRLYMDDCDERGLIDMLNMYAEDGLEPQQIVNKMMGIREDEETVDYAQLADDVCASYRGPLSRLDLKDSINYIIKMVAKKIGKTVDALTPEELTAIQKAAKHSVWYVSEQEEEDYGMNDLRKWRDSLDLSNTDDDDADEETYTAYDDTDGIWMIINIMRKKGMLRAQGIEGRDDVDDGHAIDKAYDLIEQKLDEEGMWIGDDDHEAERFVSFFGDEIAEEAMKSAIHNQEQEELPQMERHDMILEIAYVLDESFGVDDNDGDLDDIYYAVARFLNLMTYYTPESKDDIMNWCREWHEDIAEIINTPADGNVLKGFVDDAFECLLEEGGCPEFYDLPKEQVKQAIYKALCNTPESELPWGRHYAINAWTKDNVQKIRKFLTK
jgi:hypothetical protein